MVSQRKIWITLNGQQRETGNLESNYIDGRARIIRTSPPKKLNGFDVRFQLFEELLRGKGYEPKIYEDGSITLCIPVSDKYGWILREIATVYYLAMKMEATQ